MKYFRTSKWNGETCIHFFNRGWSIYSSVNKPNLLTELGIKPNEFVNKANALFEKYQIQIPKSFPKYSTIEHEIKGKKVDNFPIRNFLICIYCCIILDQNYKMDPSKILRSELIQPNSNRGIHHACSMATIALHYLNEGRMVSIPTEKDDQLNPDLIIDNFKCEVKTIQEKDWEKEIDPETGFGKVKSRGADLCYDVGKFIEKENSGYKGILQAEMVFADLTLKSFGEVSKDIRGFGYEDNFKKGLPELKKYRIVFFSRYNLECVAYYVDFEPRLWKLINLASGIEYQPAKLSFSIPADGKPHRIEIPPPPEEDWD